MNKLDKPIAEGRTAEIFLYENGKVLKLFFATIPKSWIDRETDIGQYIQEMKLPVPKVYGNVQLNDREGIIYEKIEGSSLLNELARKPWAVGNYARMLANLHAQIHAVSAPPNLESQKEWAKGGIAKSNKLPKDLQGEIIHLLNALPVGNQLCHGDFHPGNIIVTTSGPIIIDWMTASKGAAIGDVARTSIILEAAKAPEGTPMRWLLEWVRKYFLKTYLETYFQLHPDDKSLLSVWQTIMAANFYADASLPEEEKNLMEIIQRSI